MTLIYKYNDKKYTLEELAIMFYDKWSTAIKEDYNTFHGSCLSDIIIEASDNFEEILLIEDDICIEYITSLDNEFDLNTLLTPLI